nr:odorant binding protein 24 [Aromia bungii]
METLVQQLHATCVSKTGVSEGLITAVNTDKILADDESLKCYIKCIMQETGIIDDEGIVDVDAAIELLPEDYKTTFGTTIRTCGTKKGSTACENAWLTHKCYAENPQYRLI